MQETQFNPAMLVLARDSRGYTQTEVAKMTGLPQPAISRIESGVTPPTPETIRRLSKALRYTEDIFCLGEAVFGTGCSFLFHRERKTMPVPEQRRITAIVNILRLQINRLLRNIELDSVNEFTTLDPDQHKGPEGVARLLRAFWKLPPGPIASMVGTIEAASGIVVEYRFNNPKVDGISQWVPDAPPLFFVNTPMAGDRQRFTLAHEVGHVVMHMFPDETIEDEANRFAAEFLMPAAEIGPSLSGLTLERAAGLKAQWRVSMQAIIRRAIVLHEITPAQYTSLCKQINMWGYRVVEPMPVAAEHATLIRAAVDVHIKDHQRTADELRGLTMLSDLVEFRENYISDPTRMFRVLA